jgi:hypothetical protein
MIREPFVQHLHETLLDHEKRTPETTGTGPRSAGHADILGELIDGRTGR